MPGSGKSTFLRRFAQEQRFFYWENDVARRRLFDDPRHDQFEGKLLSRAARYVLEEALQADVSCVYDVNSNRRQHRQELARLAELHGGRFWLLWVQTPLELARERTEQRRQAATGELRTYYDGFGRTDPNYVEHMHQRLELPADDERVIVLDGRADYDEQRAAVLERLAATA